MVVGVLLEGVGSVEHLLLHQGRADELGTHGHSLAVKAAGHGDGGQAGQVDGHGVNVAQVHLERIAQTLPQLGGDGGGHRSQQQIIFPEGLVKGLLDDGLDLQGFLIIGVIVAGGQHEGAQQDAPLHLPAKALGAGLAVEVGQILIVTGPPAVFHAVEAGQVGAGLSGGDDIIGGHDVLHDGQLALLHLGPAALEHLSHGQHLFPHLGIQAVAEAVHRNADLHAGQIGAQPLQQVSGVEVQTGAVPLVPALKQIQHGCAVLGGAGQRADLVKGGGVSDEAVAGDGAIGGLHAGDAAVGGGLADGAAGIAAQRVPALPCRHSGGRAAGGTAGHPLQIPRVAGGAVKAGLGGGAHGELVHVQLAHHHAACGAELFHDRGVIGRRELAQDLGGAGGLDVQRADVVLHAGRHTGQRTGGPFCLVLVQRSGLCHGLFGQHGNEGVVLALTGGNGVQRCPGRLPGAHLSGPNGRAQLEGGQIK